MISTILRILIDYRVGLWAGLLTTGKLCLIIWTTGLMIGTLLGILAHQRPASIGIGLKTASFFLASIPTIILLFWAHYPLQELLGIVVDPIVTAATLLSLVNIVTIAQMVRTAMDDFPAQYRIAGTVCGMSSRAILRRIELPILARHLIPQFLTQQVNMLQMTLFASLISVEEIFRVAQHVNSIMYKPVEIYTTLALFFIVICLPLNVLAYGLKTKFTRNLSEK